MTALVIPSILGIVCQEEEKDQMGTSPCYRCLESRVCKPDACVCHLLGRGEIEQHKEKKLSEDPTSSGH